MTKKTYMVKVVMGAKEEYFVVSVNKSSAFKEKTDAADIVRAKMRMEGKKVEVTLVEEATASEGEEISLKTVIDLGAICRNESQWTGEVREGCYVAKIFAAGTREELVKKLYESYKGEEEMMNSQMSFGTVDFEGKTYCLAEQADHSGRDLPNGYTQAENGEEFQFEMSARAVDVSGNQYTVYWIFTDVKGDEQELDAFDYSKVDRVEEA